ncbi:hypothetical protein MmTuc01_0691 [Methanosarcina mazei Tuc01]|uniref:Uncharacterized protein n=1 Tax=Methanosarcina mazei Tuc01 TaxID=1236903 RepID=M1Q7F7_METMZ|nr:hypothetical protein MmTuc01_0691 [Methanosarcina mazei Tuc01]
MARKFDFPQKCKTLFLTGIPFSVPFLILFKAQTKSQYRKIIHL